MKNLLCSAGFHRWGDMRKHALLRSRTGVLMGTIQLGEQRCRSCEKSREVFTSGGLMLMLGSSKPQRLTPAMKQEIDRHYIPV
jgi:hypothetical protein